MLKSPKERTLSSTLKHVGANTVIRIVTRCKDAADVRVSSFAIEFVKNGRGRTTRQLACRRHSRKARTTWLRTVRHGRSEKKNIHVEVSFLKIVFLTYATYDEGELALEDIPELNASSAPCWKSSANDPVSGVPSDIARGSSSSSTSESASETDSPVDLIRGMSSSASCQ